MKTPKLPRVSLPRTLDACLVLVAAAAVAHAEDFSEHLTVQGVVLTKVHVLRSTPVNVLLKREQTR